MPSHALTRRPAALALTTALLAALSACSADPVPVVDTSTPTTDDHGAVTGATELAEPALGLTTVDATGVVRHLDLLGESVTEIAEIDTPRAVHTDGRFVLTETETGVDVVDTGVWTWDHVDHFHYYRAQARHVGVVAGSGPVGVATTTSSTSGGTGLHFHDTGEAVLLDTAALADGEVVETYRVTGTPHEGLLVPVGDHALLTRADDAGRVVVVDVLDAAGAVVPDRSHPCTDAAGTIATRVGTVVGCRDGALLATTVDDEVEVERIPYPRTAQAPPATSFAGRDGRPTVAGLADARRVWMLDTRERSWSLLDSPVALVDVTAVDDDDHHVVGLTHDGRVVVLDGESGDLVGRTRPLAARSLRTGTGDPTLVVDQQRAYLSAPVERRLYEIDIADHARIARAFETPSVPTYVAGTGR